MISNMFIISVLQYFSLFTNGTYRIRLFTGFVITWATRPVQHVDQDLPTLPQHMISPQVFGGSCCLVFIFLCCVMFIIICMFVVLIFTNGVVSIFIYEFDCASYLFRPSVIAVFYTEMKYNILTFVVNQSKLQILIKHACNVLLSIKYYMLFNISFPKSNFVSF